MHAPLGLVELDTRRLEWQAAVVEDPAHAALEIFQHVLVLDPQDPAGQYLVPVRHHRHIGAVVAADVTQAVGKLMPGGEQLLEVREAAVHCIAPRVDDARIGEYQLDERDVAERARR